MGPKAEIIPRIKLRCRHQLNRFPTRAIDANIGNNVLIARPSYCAKKLKPKVAPKVPRAGKQAAQLTADSQVPSEPNFSINVVNIIN